MSQETSERISGCRFPVRVDGHEIRSFRSWGVAERWAKKTAREMGWVLKHEQGEIVVRPPADEDD